MQTMTINLSGLCNLLFLNYHRPKNMAAWFRCVDVAIVLVIVVATTGEGLEEEGLASEVNHKAAILISALSFRKGERWGFSKYGFWEMFIL